MLETFLMGMLVALVIAALICICVLIGEATRDDSEPVLFNFIVGFGELTTFCVFVYLLGLAARWAV